MRRPPLQNNMKANGNYIGISAIIGGVSLGMIALIAIFSPDHMTSAPWIVGALSLMGFGLGYLSAKQQAG